MSVTNGLSGQGNYTYTLQTYDLQGRQQHQYLPVASSSLYTSFPGLSAANYTTTRYDELGRVVATNKGGTNWPDAKKNYSINGESEVLMYSVETVASGIVPKIYWPEGSLDVEETIDEDGHSAVSYKDLLGNLIMEKHGTASTYYVYDELGLLRYVLPPIYQETTNIDDAYVYQYDDHNRLKSKKLPKCEPETYYYDKNGRIIYTQNALLKAKGLYRVSLYDKKGRTIIIGTTTTIDNRLMDVNIENSSRQNYEEICSCGYYLPFSLVDINIETVNYYDNYIFFKYCTIINNYSQKKDLYSTNNTTGFYSLYSLTGQIVATTDGKMLYNTFYYDQKGRVIDERHSTLDGDVYKITTEYSFTDKPTQTTKVLRYGQPDSYAIETSYQYNQHNDQLAKVTVNHGGKSEDVSEITYNDLGQIQKESRANNADDVEYSYELHGWTKTITSPFFEEELFYADKINEAIPRYNGDISAQTWKVGNTMHRYLFKYNDRDMLFETDYRSGNDNFSASGDEADRYNEVIPEFTANGAVKSLRRRGKTNYNTYTYIDRLTYEYDGNQVKNITDAVGTKLSYRDAFEYVDGHKGTEALPDFEYNGAGMLVKDLDKGISKIIYNNIGLVDSICFSNGSRVKYVYAMTGEKLRVTHYTSNQLFSSGRLELGTNSVSGVSTTASTQTVANVGLSSTSSTSTTSRTGTSASVPRVRLLSKSSETLYIGGDIQVDMNGTYIYIFGGGYSEFKPEVNNADSIKYYYYTKDHLGNIRNVLTQNNDNTMTELQHTSYYPFGGIIADTLLTKGRDVQNRMYNGKEQDFSNNLFWLDYGARQYDPTRGQFTTPDPLAEKYYGWNYYTYCVNNPMKYIDPDGRKWENPMEANKLKSNISEQIIILQGEIDKNNKKLNSGKLSTKKAAKIKEMNGDLNERISNLQDAMRDIDFLGDDEETVFELVHTDNEAHGVRSSDGKVQIETSSDALSIHEIRHIIQSYKKEGMSFASDGYLKNAGTTEPQSRRYSAIADMEIEAYKFQYSMSPSSMPVNVTGINNINVKYVGRIRNSLGKIAYPPIYDLYIFQQKQSKLKING